MDLHNTNIKDNNCPTVTKLAEENKLPSSSLLMSLSPSTSSSPLSTPSPTMHTSTTTAEASVLVFYTLVLSRYQNKQNVFAVLT